MNPDFSDAARRHWTDGEHLHGLGRWANADHLYGVAAECALKAVALGFGVKLDAKSEAPEGYRFHVPVLWDKFALLLGAAPHAGYVSSLGEVNPFEGWRVEQRYASEQDITRAAADAHRDGARRARLLLEHAVLDGVIRP